MLTHAAPLGSRKMIMPPEQTSDEVEFAWEECDATDGPSTLVLLGAGASADLGLPTAHDLNNLLLERLGAFYKNLSDLVFGSGQVDVERLFRVIEFIHTVETGTRPEDRRSTHEEGLDIAQLVQTWKPGLQDYLSAQLATVQGSPSGLLIDRLYDALFDLLWIQPNVHPDYRYLAWLLKSMKGGTVVTLNYDNALESTANSGVHIPIDVGIYPRDRNLEIPGYPHAKDAVRIIKLHGSLDWTTDVQTGVVRHLDANELSSQRFADKLVGNRPATPGIIFGAGNKLRPTGPYLDLYVEFRERLSRVNRLIVIGYGWRDAHVNEPIRRWLQDRRDPRLFRISRIDTRQFPWEVKHWIANSVSVQMEAVDGRASEKIRGLMRPTPRILRDDPGTATRGIE